MSFHHPRPEDGRKAVSDSELNDALESGEPEKGRLDFDKVDHEDGRPSDGPQPNTPRRPPADQDVNELTTEDLSTD
ncbi:hypothetical protein ACI2LF_36095 [Kribbella sp. NPDC020789]